MTPEFRIKILSWKYDINKHGQIKDSIPFQIKKLFARLQMKFRLSEDTIELTQSFQWDKKEVYIQHDIQELCRVLFDAFESSLSKEEENFIYDLFEGETIHVIKCCNCQHESVRSDKFLDLSLPISNDFTKIYNKNLEMAFKNYLKPEILSEGNEYRCDACLQKVKAEKFVKFLKMPKILTIQLNRFEFDLISLDKKKIYDRVSFPEILNMNVFLLDYNKINEAFSEETLENLNNRTFTLNNEAEIEKCLKDGGSVYELYSIISHCGTANSGHYKCYIKSFENMNWYCFDDSSVYKIEKERFQHIFGGKIENERTNSETPYILMYRLKLMKQVDSIGEHLIDSDLLELLKEENIRIKEEEERIKERFQILNVKFQYNGKNNTIIAKKQDKLAELKSKAIKEYQELWEIDESNIRIRQLNILNLQLLEPFENYEKSLEENGINNNKTFSFELKNSNDKFEEYDPNMIFVCVCRWEEEMINLNENEFKFDVIKVNRLAKLEAFILKLKEIYSFDNDNDLAIFRKSEISKNNVNYSEISQEEKESKDLTESGLFDNVKLYLEMKEKDWKVSKFITLFNERLPGIIVKFNIPIDSSVSKTKVTMNSYRFENTIELKKNFTIKEMKTKIGEILKLSNKEFIMKKFSHNGQELKASNDSIEKLNTNNINIYIELGCSLDEDEMKIRLVKCDIEKEKFSIFPYKFTDLGIFIISTKYTIKELKESLCEELRLKKIDLKPDNVIIRDFALEKPTKVFLDNSTVKQLKFSDSKKILIQEYTEINKDFSVDSILTSVRIWSPKDWTLSESREILIKKKIKCMELESVLLSIYAEFKLGNMSVFKLSNCNNLYLDDFEKLKFENLSENSENCIDNHPFFLNSDGNILIIKDDTHILREPTNEEIERYCKPKGKYYLRLSNKENTGGSSNLTKNNKPFDSKNPIYKERVKNEKLRVKEKGIQITVKKEEKKNENVSRSESFNEIDEDSSVLSGNSNLSKYSDEKISELNRNLQKKNLIEINIQTQNIDELNNGTEEEYETKVFIDTKK